MVRQMTITISTSTEVRGDSIALIAEVLEEIVNTLEDIEEDQQYITTKGDIEEDGYEVECHYEITTIEVWRR